MGAPQQCSTPGCGRTAAFTTRKLPAWCVPCIDDIYRAGGLEPVEPFTARGAHRRSRCLECGHHLAYRLEYVLEKNGNGYGEKVCRVCFWGKWARWERQHKSELAVTLGPLLALDPVPPEVGELLAVSPEARAEVDRWWWPTERTVAMFDLLHHDLVVDTAEHNDGMSPVIVRCRLCGYESVQLPGRMGAEMQGRWCSCTSCNARNKGACAQDVALGFATRGMHLANPEPGVETVQEATCARCGTPRRVALRQLNLDQVPCYVCDGAADPQAEHRVYLFHFPAWECFKVGITNSGNDARLLEHVRNGGELIDLIPVPNRAQAHWVEAQALALVRPWPVTGEPMTRRITGWTEMWHQDAPARVDLATIAAGLPSVAPLAARPPEAYVPVDLAAPATLAPGTTVCCAGAGAGRARGPWQQDATNAGMVVTKSVSAKTTVLVVPDALTRTSKVVAARNAGVSVMDYATFANLAGI